MLRVGGRECWLGEPEEGMEGALCVCLPLLDVCICTVQSFPFPSLRSRHGLHDVVHMGST